MAHPTDERLSGFPARRLFALVTSDEQLDRAIGALGAHVDVATVRVLSGPAGLHALDVEPEPRLRTRVRRTVHRIACHRDELAGHAAHLRRGGHLLVIPVRVADLADQLALALAVHGAHGLLWFARYTIVDVTPRYRADTTPAVLTGVPALANAGTGRIPAQRTWESLVPAA